MSVTPRRDVSIGPRAVSSFMRDIIWCGDVHFLMSDFFYALRSFRRSGLSTVIIVLTLALGIGATTAIFSVVEAVLLRPLPYRDPAKLVLVFDSPVHQRGSEVFIPYRHFLEWKKQSGSFSGLAAM